VNVAPVTNVTLKILPRLSTLGEALRSHVRSLPATSLHLTYSSPADRTMTTGSPGQSDLDLVDHGPDPVAIAHMSSVEGITLGPPISNQNHNFTQVHGNRNTVNNHNLTTNNVVYITGPRSSVRASSGRI